MEFGNRHDTTEYRHNGLLPATVTDLVSERYHDK